MLDRHGDATHDLLNQPPPLAGYGAFGADPTLGRVVSQRGTDADRIARTAASFAS